MRREHDKVPRPPIVLAGTTLVVVRSASLLLAQLASEAGPAGAQLVMSLLYYVGEAMVLTGGALLIWKAWPASRVAISLFVCLGFPLLIFVGLIDVFLFAITGDHLTPSVLRQFAGLRLFTSTNFTEPVRAHAIPISFALTVVFGSFAAFMGLFWKRGRRPQQSRLTWSDVLRWNGVGAAALAVPLLLGVYGELDRPVEVLYVEDLLGADGVRLARSEREAIAGLREFIGLPPGRRWLDERYPLVHGPDPAAPAPEAVNDPPDVVVILIESLRGQCLDFIVPGEQARCTTPHLSSLARRGVVFPNYISNGFPSGPGFIALSCSTWPHHRKRIVPDFKHIAFDSLALRLASVGYHTIGVDGDANFDMQSYWHHKFFQTEVDLRAMGLFSSEKVLFEKARERIEAHDGDSRGPLYLQIKTTNPHLPYETPDDGVNESHWGDSLEENYASSMAYVDKQIGGFLDFLASRDRALNTVVVVTGDHANYLDQKKTTALPLNETVWTGAVLHGPERLVGPARRELETASHIDVEPTILALVGDRRPSGAIGRNLLGAPRVRPPSSVAIRPGGIRLDRAGYSLMVDRKQPSAATVSEAFPGSASAGAAPAEIFEDGQVGRLLEYALTFSYLIEHDRIWHPRFLDDGHP